MTIVLFGNIDKQETCDTLAHVEEYLTRHHVDVIRSDEWPTTRRVDMAISVGGDGTFLSTAAKTHDLHIPILGINSGHLGFLADVRLDEMDNALDELLQGHYTLEQRSVLHITGSDPDTDFVAPYALNEVAVLKQGLSSMITIETFVNGDYLTTYRADGLLVVTPTGSTAYNLSIGGPIMLPQTHGILLTPVASHSLSARPLVIPDDRILDLTITSRNGRYMLSIDGRSHIIDTQVRLHIERAADTVPLVRIGARDFLSSLKDKLGWGK